ncbi:hypothetical protein HNR42_000422 [Deinobacterium chartae]|uniref:PatA-like N-terminal domain-containing protein n=1 Tax=Deinobacterium chartae TaxID=521158 RepID=A0A841HYJ3_9DEIO|nr:DUF4388 domain-containing protein [Deinobacterium chartae]MBB6097008.1 hypothetical protein [Deinobacterium chartae]
MRGTLGLFNLLELLQLLGIHKQPGVLLIQHPEGEAKIYFNGGRIVHAVFGEVFDHGAVLNLLRDERGEFEFQPGRVAAEETVDEPLDQFLFEVLRLLPNPTPMPTPAFSAAPEPAEPVYAPHAIPVLLNERALDSMTFSGEEFAVLAHIDGRTPIETLRQHVPRPGVLEGLLGRLMRGGVLELRAPAARTARLVVNVGRDLRGGEARLDQTIVLAWEKRLGRPVGRVRLRTDVGHEAVFEVLATPDVGALLLLSAEAMLYHGMQSGMAVLVKPEL